MPLHCRSLGVAGGTTRINLRLTIFDLRFTPSKKGRIFGIWDLLRRGWRGVQVSRWSGGLKIGPGQRIRLGKDFPKHIQLKFSGERTTRARVRPCT